MKFGKKKKIMIISEAIKYVCFFLPWVAPLILILVGKIMIL